MAIEFEATLLSNERQQLADILQCDVSNLDAVLAPFARAALSEYAGMMLGQHVFTRGSDFNEYRLVLLIKEAFGGLLPDEQNVCSLFQVSPTGARSLIRAVSAKYQYELSKEIAATMRATLQEVGEDEDGWSFIVNSDHIVEALNRFLAIIDGTLHQVTKVPGTVANYILQPSAYEALCHRFGLTPKVKATK
jgi:hypothetical protein